MTKRKTVSTFYHNVLPGAWKVASDGTRIPGLIQSWSKLSLILTQGDLNVDVWFKPAMFGEL
jgi:hypothetical protein